MNTPANEWEKEFEERFGDSLDNKTKRHLCLYNEHLGYTDHHLEVKAFISALIESVKEKERQKTRDWSEVSYKQGYENGKQNIFKMNGTMDLQNINFSQKTTEFTPANEWRGKSKTDIEAELNRWFLDEAVLTKEKVKQLLDQHSAHLVERLEAEKKPEDLHDIEWQSLTNEQIRDRRFIRSCMNQALDQAIDIVGKTNGM
jgi:hypothetical protein